MIHPHSKMQDTKLSRRELLKMITILGIGALVPTFPSCSLFSHVKGDLSKVAVGFNPYNGFNPNLKFRHDQYQTWRHNMIEHKVAWAGTQYHLSTREKIVASADGIVQEAVTFQSYHGLEDSVTIKHGDSIRTRYFHMSPHSFEKFQGKFDYFQKVKRGDVIGLGSEHFKTAMYRWGIIGDMDHYGPKMGYMNYWDGEIDLDSEPEEVKQKNRTQIDLIFKLINKYAGLGSEQLQEVHSYNKIPKTLCHKKSKYHCEPWEHAMVFKLVKHIYDNQPETFKGTKKENDGLIAKIYDNQPVILTLPFQASSIRN